jgi:hypothetical protein
LASLFARAKYALALLEQATTACPYCGSFESRLLGRGITRPTRNGKNAPVWDERQCASAETSPKFETRISDRTTRKCNRSIVPSDVQEERCREK